MLFYREDDGEAIEALLETRLLASVVLACGVLLVLVGRRYEGGRIRVLKNRHSVAAGSILVALFAVHGCRESPQEPPSQPDPPEVRGSIVEPSPHNALSARVRAIVVNASEASVEFGEGDSIESATPFFPVAGDSVRIPVLGLRGSTTYAMQLVARAASGQTARGDTMSFTTGELPGDLPQYRILANNEPADGYVLVGVPRDTVSGIPAYALILDNDGRIVWYKAFDGLGGSLPAVDFQLQHNNNYTIYAALGSAAAHFYEVDRFGDVVNEYHAATSNSTGVHEIRLFSGGYTLYANDHRRMDLTGIGGLADQEVRGMTVEMHRSGFPLFVFNTFDHFEVTDADGDVALSNPATFINPWHSNGIDVDNDGHLLVSWRNTSTVTRINTQTGEILWTLGKGKRNEFSFVNDPLGGFWKQHAIRRLPGGNVLLFDNGNQHTPPQSRAVEYLLDETARTATMVWEYRPSPPIFGAFTGNAQRLANGNTFVCFGSSNRIQEVTADGIVQWDAEFTITGRVLYRAFRVESLY